MHMAASYVSFDEVKARVSMEQLLDRYDLLDNETKRKGDELALHCVFHANDRSPSLKINTAKNIFNCFGCNKGGDVIGFVVLKEGIATGDPDHDRREAALRLQEWFNLSGKRPKKTSPRTNRRTSAVPGGAVGNVPPSTDGKRAATAREPAREGEEAGGNNPPLSFTLQNLDPDHSFFAERGLSKATIATFGLGYHAGKGTMHGRIVIPIHNERGELVAYAGRWPGDEPPEGEDKYRFPANFKKSFILYNLHRALEHASEGLIVTEGFFSGVFALWQRGRKNVVAIMGSQLSAEQERLIVDTVGIRGRVLLAFDADDAGRRGMREAAQRLVSQVFVRTVELA
jgi:DNA primase